MTRHPLTPLERAALWLGAKSEIEREAFAVVCAGLGACGALLIAYGLSQGFVS